MMPRRLLIPLLLLLSGELAAQRLADIDVDDRIEALNAVFAFRTDLLGDSTYIARCSIPTAPADSRKVPGLDPRFQRLIECRGPILLRQIAGTSD